MRASTSLILAAAASLLAACAGPTGGMGRALPPAHAVGEGIALPARPSVIEQSVPPAAAHNPPQSQAGQQHAHECGQERHRTLSASVATYRNIARARRPNRRALPGTHHVAHDFPSTASLGAAHQLANSR